MRLLSLARQKDRIDALFDKAGSLPASDVEMQSDWAKYLCVLVAGFLENALKEVYGDYAGRQASEPVKNFVRRNLDRITNPKKDVFSQVAFAFKKTWGHELETHMNQAGGGDAIQSIISNRINIAHGRDSDISLVRLRDWFKSAVKVVEFIEQQCA